MDDKRIALANSFAVKVKELANEYGVDYHLVTEFGISKTSFAASVDRGLPTDPYVAVSSAFTHEFVDKFIMYTFADMRELLFKQRNSRNVIDDTVVIGDEISSFGTVGFAFVINHDDRLIKLRMRDPYSHWSYVVAEFVWTCGPDADESQLGNPNKVQIADGNGHVADLVPETDYIGFHTTWYKNLKNGDAIRLAVLKLLDMVRGFDIERVSEFKL